MYRGVARSSCVSASSPGVSALATVDGRQRQDAAIAGVEVLRVAPRPENSQQ